MLKRIKGELSSSQTYCVSLETELGIWRSGGRVAESDWVSLQNLKEVTLQLRDSAPDVSTPPLATPISAWSSDEKEEFLKRENELADQLEESEALLKKRNDLIETMKEELAFFRSREESIASVCLC